MRKHGVCESENASTWQDSLARSLADSADVCITCIASMDEGSFAFRQAELFKQLPEALNQGCFRWSDALTVTCALPMAHFCRSFRGLNGHSNLFELVVLAHMCSSLKPYSSIARQPAPAGSCTDRCDAPREPSRSWTRRVSYLLRRATSARPKHGRKRKHRYPYPPERRGIPGPGQARPGHHTTHHFIPIGCLPGRARPWARTHGT